MFTGGVFRHVGGVADEEPVGQNSRVVAEDLGSGGVDAVAVEEEQADVQAGPFPIRADDGHIGAAIAVEVAGGSGRKERSRNGHDDFLKGVLLSCNV